MHKRVDSERTFAPQRLGAFERHTPDPFDNDGDGDEDHHDHDYCW